MLNLKKTAVAVLALSSSAVFAGTMGPVCSAVPVTMPCESSGWEIGARALWMNIGAGNQTTTVVSSAGGDLTTNVGPGFGWGFQINGAMTYGTGKNVSLDWYHINNTHDRTLGPVLLTGNPAFVSGSQFLSGTYVSSVASNGGTATANPKMDDVNMLFGQHVDFSDVTSANLAWGWKWARVAGSNAVAMNGNIATVTSGADPVGTAYNFTANGSNTFNGFGPEVSLLGEYELIDHLNIYGKGDFSALAGFSKSSMTYGDVVTGGTVTGSSSVVAITPVVAGKLGLNYGWDMTGFGVVAFDVNYDFRQYINAFRNVNPSLSSGNHSSSSFSAQGIVFGLDLKFVNA
jgi:hypothetical protein